MNTGERNVKGRIIYVGPRGGHYVLSNGKKVYKFTKDPTVAHVKTGLRNTRGYGNIFVNTKGLKYTLMPNGFQRTYNVLYNSGRVNINGDRILTREIQGIKENFAGNAPIYKVEADPSIKYIIKILRSAGFQYESNIIEKIELAHIYYPVKHLTKTNAQFKNQITMSIGACHINTSNLSRMNYLPAMYEQLKEASRIIRGNILFRKMTKQDFIDKFSQMTGGRPCIENLVQALTDIAFGEAGWRGKNTSILLRIQNGRLNANSFRTLKNQVLAPYIGEVFNKLPNAKKISFNENSFWKSVKNKDIYAFNQTVNNVPKYYVLKNVPNARAASLVAFENYGNYLNRPNKYNVLAKAIKKVRTRR